MPENSPARVLHFMGLAHGGVETVLTALCRRLDPARVQVDLALPEWVSFAGEEQMRGLGVRVWRFPAPRRAAAPALGRAAARLIREHGPYAAVHSHLFLPGGLLLRAAHRAGVPVRIAHAHTLPPERPSLQFRWYRRAMRRLLLRHATHLLACSPSAAQATLGAACRDPRVQIFPNPVELEPYAELPPDRSAVRREWVYPQAGPLLGYVGRLTAVKNLPFLCAFFANLSRLAPAAHLLIVGAGGMRSWLEEWREREGLADRVHLTGWREDIPRIMSALDVLLLPSFREGLGNVVLEAQAAGTPCLCSPAVPPEADLGLGLVRRIPIDEGLAPWLAALSAALETPRPPWEARRERFLATGHDAASLARRLEKIYLGEEASD